MKSLSCAELLRVLVVCACLCLCPSVLDATQITLSPSGDARVFSGTPGLNDGSYIELTTGFQSASNSNEFQTFIKFNLPPDLSGATINEAWLRLRTTGIVVPGPDCYVLGRATANWSESSITWSNRPSINEGLSDCQDVNTANAWIEWEVYDIVQSWLNGAYSNFGFGIRDVDWGQVQVANFHSREASSLRPELFIDYTAPSGDGRIGHIVYSSCRDLTTISQTGIGISPSSTCNYSLSVHRTSAGTTPHVFRLIGSGVDRSSGPTSADYHLFNNLSGPNNFTIWIDQGNGGESWSLTVNGECPDIRIEPTSLSYPPGVGGLQIPRSQMALLHLRQRDVEVPAIANTRFDSALTACAVSTRLMLIYDHSIETRDVKDLQSRNVTVLGMIPNRGILITAPRPGSLRGISGLIGIEPVQPEDKLGRTLLKIASLEAPTVIGVLISFFSDVDPEEIAAVARRFAVAEIPNDYIQRESRVWTISTRDIQRISREGAVRFVLLASDPLLNNEPVHHCSAGYETFGDALDYVLHDDGWDGPGQGTASLTYHFVNSTPDLPVADQRIEIARGLNEWTRHVNVTWTETATVGANQSMDILFTSGDHGDGTPFDGPNGYVAHCFYPAPPNSEPIGGDCHFDEAETWLIHSDLDLFSVALHEAGHGLGLGHSDDPNAVMYPVIHGVYSGLHQDDINGIQAIYTPRTDGCFTIFNDGPGELRINEMSLRDHDEWVVGWAPEAPFQIQPGQQVEVCVNVNLDFVQGIEDDQLQVYSNDCGESPYPGAVMLTATEHVCFGDLQVNSSPAGASITLNGSPTGIVTPHVFSLACGTYAVELDQPCYQHWTSSPVLIAEGSTIILDQTLVPTPGFLALTTPNGGETWHVGSNNTIIWSTTCLNGNVDIKLNRNYPNGSWEVLYSGIPVNSGQVDWPATDGSSGSCRLAIVSSVLPTVADTSNANFSIVGGTPEPVEDLTILVSDANLIFRWSYDQPACFTLLSSVDPEGPFVTVESATPDTADTLVGYMTAAPERMHFVVVAEPGSNCCCQSTSRTVAYFPFNSSNDAVTPGDSSGHGHHGTATNLTWLNENCGGVLYFDSATDVVTASVNGATFDNQLTVEALVKPTAAPSGQSEIIFSWNGADGNRSFQLWYGNNDSGNGLTFLVYTPSGNGMSNTATSLPVGTYSHVAATYDGLYLRLFLDGVEVDNTPWSGNIIETSGPWYIGSWSNTVRSFPGYIDYVRLSSIALSPSEFCTTP